MNIFGGVHLERFNDSHFPARWYGIISCRPPFFLGGSMLKSMCGKEGVLVNET